MAAANRWWVDRTYVSTRVLFFFLVGTCFIGIGRWPRYMDSGYVCMWVTAMLATKSTQRTINNHRLVKYHFYNLITCRRFCRRQLFTYSVDVGELCCSLRSSKASTKYATAPTDHMQWNRMLDSGGLDAPNVAHCCSGCFHFSFDTHSLVFWGNMISISPYMQNECVCACVLQVPVKTICECVVMCGNQKNWRKKTQQFK